MTNFRHGDDTPPPPTPISDAPGSGPERSSQARVDDWLRHTFDDAVADSREERALRFLEEALELVQACGATPETIDRMADHVFGREFGEIPQEFGGVALSRGARHGPRASTSSAPPRPSSTKRQSRAA